MINYTEKNNRVNLEMDRGDYERLLLLLGMLSGKFFADDALVEAWSVISFCNRMNETHPNFQQYEIPKEYQ